MWLRDFLDCPTSQLLQLINKQLCAAHDLKAAQRHTTDNSSWKGTSTLKIADSSPQGDQPYGSTTPTRHIRLLCIAAPDAPCNPRQVHPCCRNRSGDFAGSSKLGISLFKLPLPGSPEVHPSYLCFLGDSRFPRMPGLVKKRRRLVRFNAHPRIFASAGYGWVPLFLT